MTNALAGQFQDAKGVDSFGEDLQKDFRNYTSTRGRFAGPLFWLKAVILIGVWFALYIHIVFFSIEPRSAFFLAICWGLCSLLIIFNIGHDAVHGVVSGKSWVNRILKYSFNLVGGNAYSWKLKHNVAHHLHTNIEGKDFDTDLSPLMRLSPETPFRKQYRFQHITCFIVYPLLSLLIISVADFKIFFQAKQAGHVKKHPISEWVILLVTKIYYIGLVFVIPLIWSSFSLQQILLTFFAYHFINGIIIALVFMPSHYFSGSGYYASEDKIDDWYKHQLSATMDLSPGNRFISAILGGLNHNVAHHLFPNLCHTHYFELSRIIKRRAREHGISYNELPYRKAISAHLLFLKSLEIQNG